MKKFTVKFYLREKTFNPKNRQYKLYCRITYGGQSAHFAISGYAFTKEEWHQERQEHLTDDGVNEELLFIRNRLMEIKRELYYQKKQISPYRVRMVFEGKLDISGTVYDLRLTDYMSEFLRFVTESPEHSAGTVKNYRVKFNRVHGFLQDKGLQAVCLYEVDEHFLQKLDDYLVRYKSGRHHRPLKRRSVNDIHVRFRAMLGRAKRERLIKQNPYEFWKIPADKAEKPLKYLTEEELAAIEQADFSDNERLQRIKDKFLFACYTSLPFADVQKLTVAEVKQGPKGLYIERSRSKTQKALFIPLLAPAERIYKKYKALHYHEINGRLFPPISNEKTNVYLKELARVCGIEKNLTFHMARHTCGTYLLNAGMSLKMVSEILSHSSVRTTEIYAKVTKGNLWKEMGKIDEKLKGRGSSDSEENPGNH